MKRLFGRDKPKIVKASSANAELFPPGPEDSHYSNDSSHYVPSHIPDRAQIHPQDRSPVIVRSSSEEPWDVVSSQDGSPVPTPFVPRAVSPFGGTHSVSSTTSGNHHDRDRDSQMARKKHSTGANTPAALNILRALDPLLDASPTQKEHFDDSFHPQTAQTKPSEKKEKKGFWERASGRDKDKDKSRSKEKERRDEEGQADITRMIGYLTATGSEDWSLVLEVSEKASSNETAAKETAKALRREFKYAEPSAQLAAARLWAVLLRNASGIFISQCASKKFLDTVEEVIQASGTAPVVRERLLNVLAAAAYASGSNASEHSPFASTLGLVKTLYEEAGRHDKDPFRQLWRKLKGPTQPDEGIPFDADDSMLNPPLTPAPAPDTSPLLQYQRPSHTRHKTPSETKIVPPEEDMRRLFEECRVAKGNASLLSEALAFAKPEDLKHKSIIREFHARCRASQEMIYTQIPWATANAERSRQAAGRVSPVVKRKNSAGTPRSMALSLSGEQEDRGLTIEEELLAALLDANEELTGALRVYEDLERVKIERETERRSRKETRMDPRQRPPQDHYNNSSASLSRPQSNYNHNGQVPPSPSPSPSPPPSVIVTPIVHSHTHPLPPIPYQNPPSNQIGSQTLAVPPPAPHGPRLPLSHTSGRSRSPSPDRLATTPSPHHTDYTESSKSQHLGYIQSTATTDESSFSEPEFERNPQQPSAKALGKRRQVEPDDADNPFDPDDMFYDHNTDSRQSDSPSDSDSDDPYSTRKRPQIHYVYDAATERTNQRIKEGLLAAAALNGLR